MEQKILEYYAECLKAEEKTEKAYDEDRRSVRKREQYQWCTAQVMALEELMCELGIDYDDLEDDEE